MEKVILVQIARTQTDSFGTKEMLVKVTGLDTCGKEYTEERILSFDEGSWEAPETVVLKIMKYGLWAY